MTDLGWSEKVDFCVFFFCISSSECRKQTNENETFYRFLKRKNWAGNLITKESLLGNKCSSEK